MNTFTHSRWKIVACLFLLGASGISDAKDDSMKIILKVGDEIIEATLQNNPTSRDFISLLPLKLKLEDYNRTEKISYPPRKLSTVDAPVGVEPKIGDIAYYGPWGNIAIFYRDFKYSPGLIKIGTITSNLNALKSTLSTEIHISKPDV